MWETTIREPEAGYKQPVVLPSTLVFHRIMYSLLQVCHQRNNGMSRAVGTSIVVLPLLVLWTCVSRIPEAEYFIHNS
jgi:hypothetical protein